VDESMQKALINLFNAVILRLDTLERRLEKLEEIEQAFGIDIPDWLDRLEASIRSDGGNSAAVKAIEAFRATHYALGPNGKPVYERKSYDKGIHTIAIVYDGESPEEEKVSFRLIPDIDAMSLDELKEYRDDLLERVEYLDNNEPDDETSDEYRQWEYDYSTADEALEEANWRIEELGGEPS